MEVKKRLGKVYTPVNVMRSMLGIETLRPVSLYYVSFAPSFYVNTLPSKGAPWVFKLQSEPSAYCELDPEFVDKLIDALSEFPSRIEVPEGNVPLSIPRYYWIALKGSPDSFEVATIVGMKSDLMTPTRWASDKGYWHPKCVESIINALKSLI